MSKHLTSIFINNRAFKINTLHVEAIAHRHFSISYAQADKKIQSDIRKYIKGIVADKEEVSARIIEDAIFLSFLPKKLQKSLKNLAYMRE